LTFPPNRRDAPLDTLDPKVTQTPRLCAKPRANARGEHTRLRSSPSKRYDGAARTPPVREVTRAWRRGTDMTSDALRDAYQRDGFIVVPDLLGSAELTELRQIIAELVAGAAAVDTHTAVYDLEPGHTRAEPKVRRIKTPHKVHPAFDAVVRRPGVMEILTLLLGPAVRLHCS